MKELNTFEEIEIVLFKYPLSNLVQRLCYYRRLERVWRLIEKSYSDSKLSLCEAATYSGIDKNHLNTLFHQAIELTFHQFLIRYRLLNSIIMIRDKNYSFLEIALASGFGSLSAFQRNFRSVFGVTPSQLKKSIKHGL